MPYKISKQEPNKVDLLTLDPDGETYVIVKKANGRDELAVQELITTPYLSYTIPNYGKIREETPVPDYLVHARKAWRTLVECNILDADDQKLFTSGMTWEHFMKGWDVLPDVARQAINRAVVQENPHWGN